MFEGFKRWLRRGTKTKSAPMNQGLDYHVIGGDGGGALFEDGLPYSGTDKVIYHRETRMNTRRAHMESLRARALIDNMVEATIGVGLKLEATPVAELLGRSHEEMEAWAADVERRWELFANDPEQSVDGTMNYNQTQQLWMLCYDRDGESFSTYAYSSSKRLISPLMFNIMDANQIRGNAVTSTYAQLYQDDGIVRDKNGREIGYKVWIADPVKPGYFIEKKIPKWGRKSGRPLMIHGYNKEYGGQGRGFSKLAVLLQTLADLTMLDATMLRKAINQSAIMMSTENMQQTSGHPWEGMGADEILALGGLSGEAQKQAAQQAAIDPLTFTNNKKVQLGVGDVVLVNNKRGDKIVMHKTEAPADDYKAFSGAVFDNLAAAAGSSVEFIEKKFSSSYSASRGTLKQIWVHINKMRTDVGVKFNTPTYGAWLAEEIAAGRISAPGWKDPLLRRAWSSCQWVGESIPNIDPLRDAKAREIYAKMSLTSLQREARDLNGSDIKTNIRKNRVDFAEMPGAPWNGVAETKEAPGEEDDKAEGDKD